MPGYVYDRSGKRKTFGRSASEISKSLEESGIPDDPNIGPDSTLGTRTNKWVSDLHAKGKRVGDE